MIDLQVRSASGSVVVRAEHGIDWTAALDGLEAAQFPVLAGVCPSMDTVFTTWQVPLLLAELDRLPPQRQGPWCGAVRAMCRAAEAEPHRYVWFLGD